MLWDILVWSYLGSCMELLLLTTDCASLNSPGISLLPPLNHHQCITCLDLHLAKNMTLFHIPTCCLPHLREKSLLWLLQYILIEGCSPIVLKWCKIWFLPHPHACVAPWYILSSTSYLPSTSLSLLYSLFPHKRIDLHSILAWFRLLEYSAGTLYLNTNLFNTPYFIPDLTLFLTTTIFTVSKYLVCLSLLISSLFHCTVYDPPLRYQYVE